MEILYDSYRHADTMEGFAKFLQKSGTKPHPAIAEEVKKLRDKKQVIITKGYEKKSPKDDLKGWLKI